MTPPEHGTLAEYWPLFGLRLATPRLVLTPITDDDIVELVDLVLAGIHDPAVMPFAMPWTQVPRDELIPNSIRYFWQTRSKVCPAEWTVQFGVRAGGVLVGLQDVGARDFTVTRVVHTGSWLGRAHQGRGFGTEIRCAVVEFAFDHLKAGRAESGAFVDNLPSLRVSEKVGYQPNGTEVIVRRPGDAAVSMRLLVTPETFRRPPWRVQVAGLAACRALLGG